jgi:glycosyltransferase involved in cell wall biosynthesis
LSRTAASPKAESLRIALISESVPPVANGVSTAVCRLAGELKARGHQALICGPAFARIEWDGETMPLPAWPAPGVPEYPLARPLTPIQAARIAAWKPDVIHTHTPFLSGQAGALAARLRGIRHVSTFHTRYDLYSHYSPIPKAVTIRFLRAWCRRFYRRCDAVLTPSEFARQHLIGYGIDRPIQIVPNGIPEMPELGRDEARRMLRAEPDGLVILSAGRLAVEKSFDLLIRAYSAAEIERSELWLVGDGPERESLAALASNLGARVRFWGRAAPEQMPAFFAACDLFAFASTTETQGLVVQEAMVSGRPVVCVRGGAAFEAVEAWGCGIVCGGTERELAMALRQAAVHPGWNEWARRAKEGSRAYSMEAMGEACLAAYRG